MALTENDIDRIRAQHTLCVGDTVFHRKTGETGTVTKTILRNGLVWRVFARFGATQRAGYASGFEKIDHPDTAKTGGNNG